MSRKPKRVAVQKARLAVEEILRLKSGLVSSYCSLLLVTKCIVQQIAQSRQDSTISCFPS